MIFGTVFGADLRPAAQIRVKLRRNDQRKTKEVHANRRGEFEFRLPARAADYIVGAELKKRQASEKSQVNVHVEYDERWDVAVHLTE